MTELKAAFNDTKVKAAVQKHMKQENIQFLRKDSREPIFRRELTLIGQLGEEKALNHEDDLADETHLEPEEAQVVS